MALDPRDEKIIQRIPELPRIMAPKCPSCSHEPLQFACNVLTTGMGHIVAIIWCSDCGHTLNTQFVGTQPPQPESRIMRPT
jgi:hypothetical protein